MGRERVGSAVQSGGQGWGRTQWNANQIHNRRSWPALQCKWGPAVEHNGVQASTTFEGTIWFCNATARPAVGPSAVECKPDPQSKGLASSAMQMGAGGRTQWSASQHHTRG